MVLDTILQALEFAYTFTAWPLIIGILFTGLFLTIRLGGHSMRAIPYAVRQLWAGRTASGEGEIPPFKALMTALSATVGVGNIAGVGTAISVGGPGALFWMWVVATFGIATKYSEAYLAVSYREKRPDGSYVGGPMYYIKNGLGPKFAPLAMAFALFAGIASFGIGNATQSSAIADSMRLVGVPPMVTGVVLACLVGFVVIGGIKRIASWASALVPFMGLLYVSTAVVIVGLNFDEIPAVFSQVFKSAFGGTAVTGGFAGATVWAAIQLGVQRGVTSNEAGLGSAAIAHAAAQTKDPVTQGSVAMLGTIIDTLIVCTLTGLVILLTSSLGAMDPQNASVAATGAALTSHAFAQGLSFGAPIVALCIVVFAYTTILGWSYYGEKCWEYAFGAPSVHVYRVLWVLATLLGPLTLYGADAVGVVINLVWRVSDFLNVLMAMPNLIALVLLSPVLAEGVRQWRKRQAAMSGKETESS